MKIKVTSDEFINVIMSLLLDKMVRPEEVLPNNEGFNEIVDKLLGKGMKPYLLQYYLSMNAYERLNYKRIKPSFTEKYDNSLIEINNEGTDLNESIDISQDVYYIKTVLKKILKILKQRKWLHGKITTEEMLDKIINDVLQKEKM